MKKVKPKEAAYQIGIAYSTFIASKFYKEQKSKYGFISKQDLDLYLQEIEERKRIPKPVWKSDAV